jgi:cellulose synthase/poly-beta-1,6-N-acetylglucosamine synthase-like glycosyltransferase
MLQSGVLFVSILSIPFWVAALTLLMQVVAAAFGSRVGRDPHSHVDRPPCAVVMPAHNEEAGIARSISSVQAQLSSDDMLLVVADNCTDRTADVANALGATVIVRTDTTKVGKGHALAHGVQFLKEHAKFDVIVFVDADCVFQEHCLSRLVLACDEHQRPIQGRYLMTSRNDIQGRIKEFAFRIRNWTRPAGGFSLGFPSPMTGSGMAFPKAIMETAQLATSHLTEDLKLGLDCVLDGRPPLFCEDAVILSEFPTNQEGAAEQKRRWEKGHLSLIRQYIPRLLYSSLFKGRFYSIGSALDIMVPPVAALVAVNMLLMLAGLLIGLFIGWSSALIVPISAAPITVFAIGIAWLSFGRDLLGSKDILMAPAFVTKRIGEVVLTVLKKNQSWKRTERN